MFSGLLSALGPPGGPPQEEKDPELQQAEVQDESQGEQAAPARERGSSAGGGPSAAFNLWGLASAVTSTVRAHTEEIVKSVQATDWKAELMAFSKEAAEEGKTLQHATAELVEHLPEKLEQAEKAAVSLPKQLGSAPEVQLPDTLKDIGGSLRVFGQSLLVGTKELIEQVRDGVESEIAVATRETKRAGRASKSNAATAAAAKLGTVAPGGKYSRFEAEVAAMQRDSSTYCDEPPDSSDYANWRSTHSIAAVQSDIDRILNENAFMAELHARIVPIIVENEDFWARYFYRLHKLQAREETRHQLAQRAKALNEEEELGWDDDEGAQEEKPAPAEQAAEPAQTEAPEAHAEAEVSHQATAGAHQATSSMADASTSDAAAEEENSSSRQSHEQEAPHSQGPAAEQQPGTTSGSPGSSQGGSAEAVEHGDQDSVAAESASDSSVKGEWVTVSTVHPPAPGAEGKEEAHKAAGTPRKQAVESSSGAQGSASPAQAAAAQDSPAKPLHQTAAKEEPSQEPGVDGVAGSSKDGSSDAATTSAKASAALAVGTAAAAGLVGAAAQEGPSGSKAAGGSGEDEDEAWGDWD